MYVENGTEQIFSIDRVWKATVVVNNVRWMGNDIFHGKFQGFRRDWFVQTGNCMSKMGLQSIFHLPCVESDGRGKCCTVD